MKIVGYSERGAMNALFYGMAFNKDERKGEKDMQSFLELAKVPNYNHYHQFEIYTEFSLSQFGSPDLIIFAEKGDVKTVFFIEAKVSACKHFKMESIQTEYEKGQKEKPNTSNLFYQLEQKKGLFDNKDKFHSEETTINTNRGSKSIGNNPVVRNLVEELKKCDNAEYIAIVPSEGEEKMKEPKIEGLKKTIEDLNLKIVYWEDLYQKFGNELKYESLIETFLFNQGKDPKSIKTKSQILNKPI